MQGTAKKKLKWTSKTEKYKPLMYFFLQDTELNVHTTAT